MTAATWQSHDAPNAKTTITLLRLRYFVFLDAPSTAVMNCRDAIFAMGRPSPSGRISSMSFQCQIDDIDMMRVTEFCRRNMFRETRAPCMLHAIAFSQWLHRSNVRHSLCRSRLHRDKASRNRFLPRENPADHRREFNAHAAPVATCCVQPTWPHSPFSHHTSMRVRNAWDERLRSVTIM